jgi:hypothetical protein
MTITYTGILRVAPGVILPAVGIQELADNLLNACPELSLTIDTAAAGTNVCIVRHTPTNSLLFSSNEPRRVLSRDLPLLGTGLLDLAEELDH